jgi:hypothetical protein
MHLQEFVIFNLSNLFFSLIHLHQDLFSVLISFFTLPLGFPLSDVSQVRSYIYMLETCFFQVVKKCQVFCQTIRWMFSAFLLKIKNDNRIWQTVRDALRIWINICHMLFVIQACGKRVNITQTKSFRSCNPITFSTEFEYSLTNKQHPRFEPDFIHHNTLISGYQLFKFDVPPEVSNIDYELFLRRV